MLLIGAQGGEAPGAGGETAAEKKKREEKRRDRRNAGENSITFKSLRARQRQAAAPRSHTSLCGACFLLRLHRKRAFFCGRFPSDGAWSQFALWTFLKEVPARNVVFCGANSIALGLGQFVFWAQLFILPVRPRLWRGAFGRRKPSGKSPLSSPTPPAVGGLFWPLPKGF